MVEHDKENEYSVDLTEEDDDSIEEEYSVDLTKEDDTSSMKSDDDSIEEEYSMDLTEDDIISIMETGMELIDEYYTANVLSISSAKFSAEVIAYTLEIIITDIDCMLDDQLTKEEADDMTNELYELVCELHGNYTCIQSRPHRSMSTEDPIEEVALDVSQISKLACKIRELTEIPQPEQKTAEWYEFRYNLISASNLWKVFGSNALQNSLIYEKCKPLDISHSIGGVVNTGSSLHWGIKYEPLTVMIYEMKYNTKVGEFGCIRHPEFAFIGASPDGINIDPTNVRYGRMLEIKNIVNREITGIPKQEYWIQTQIQMETCDLDECDFVETRFKEYESESMFYEDTVSEYKGIILNFISQHAIESFAPVYKYMPLNIPLDKSSVEDWVLLSKDAAKQDGLALYSVIYWRLDQISSVIIPRNKEWFRLACPKIEAIWKTILHERETGYEHRAARKRVPKLAPAQVITVVRLPSEEMDR